jgi:hypothetical protein
MKNKTSTLNRVFSKIFSFVLLMLLSLAPVINPVTASTNNPLVTPQASLMMPPITVTQTNATAIVINDNPVLTVPYPSTITIAGAVGTITNVTVTFNNLSITRPRDLDILLVGPGGQAFILMSDVAGSLDTADSNNVTITLSDAAASFLPSDAVGTTTLVSGTFKPTNNGNGEGSLPAPAPAGPYNNPTNAPGGTVCTGCTSTFASVYAQPGVPANGVWSLYVDDDGGGGAVGANTMAGGWTLSVTTNGIPTTAANANVSGRVVTANGRGVSGARVGMNEPSGQVRYATSNPFGYFSFAEVQAGETYIFSVKAKGYQPTSVAREVTEDVSDLEIVVQE